MYLRGGSVYPLPNTEWSTAHVKNKYFRKKAMMQQLLSISP